MASKASLQLKGAIDKIKKGLINSASTKELKKLGNEAIYLIQKRTRLGYGVKTQGGLRESLKSMRPHKKSYTEWREKHHYLLSPYTTPKKVNLTLTGVMLEKIKIIEIKEASTRFAGSLKVGVTGYHPLNGVSYVKIANALAKKGWLFLNLTRTELNQLSRFYKNNLSNYLRGVRAKYK